MGYDTESKGPINKGYRALKGALESPWFASWDLVLAWANERYEPPRGLCTAHSDTDSTAITLGGQAVANSCIRVTGPNHAQLARHICEKLNTGPTK